MQVTEQAAEGHVLVEVDVLVAEEDDAILGQRAMDLVLLAVAQRLAEIDAGDLGADDRRQLVDGDGLVGRAVVAVVTIAGAGVTANHDGESVYRGLYKNSNVAEKQQYPRATHPVVRTHPVTGKKALYVNRGFTRGLIGVPRDESDGILAYLYQHMENPLFQCRFRWQANSIAFWDNRCVQHRAMWDYWPHTRSGNRVTVAGDKPF